MSVRHSAEIQRLAEKYNVDFQEAEQVWDALMQEHMHKDGTALNKRIREVNKFNMRRPSLALDAERQVLIVLSTSAKDWTEVNRK